MTLKAPWLCGETGARHEFVTGYGRQGTSKVSVRTSADALSPAEFASLARAFARAYDIRDERGYGYFGGIHGLPLPMFCQHNTMLFLPWHRAYLYFFERALQDLDAGASLPWWDWGSRASHEGGIPRAFRPDYRGRVNMNPLATGPVTVSPADLARFRADPRNSGAISDGSQPWTLRDPDHPDELPRPETIARALRSPTFADLSIILESIHTSVHGWIGGAMSLIPVASFDPIFWAHHAMIDRLWYLWQISHTRVPPASMRDTVLRPFPVTVRDMVDIGSLGYDYAARVVG